MTTLTDLLNVLKINDNVIVRPGQMRSGCKGQIVAQWSVVEWKVLHEDGQYRIYSGSELEKIED